MFFLRNSIFLNESDRSSLSSIKYFWLDGHCQIKVIVCDFLKKTLVIRYPIRGINVLIQI